MQFTIVPFVAAGPIHFGMARPEIQALLGPEGVSFGAVSQVVTDYYHAQGILVEYDEDLKCAYIGLSRPLAAFYRGKDLLGLRPQQLCQLFKDDANLEKSPDTLVSRLHGLGAAFEKKQAPVASISVFKAGYYTKYDEQKRRMEAMNLDEMSVDDILNFITNG